MRFLDFREELLLTEAQKEDIISILNTMTPPEISEFGEFIYDSITDDYIEYEDEITKEEVIELLGELSSDELDYLLYMMEEEDATNTSEEMDEKVSRKMKASNRNKGIKRFSKSRAEFRKEKAARKIENRKNKVQKKKYRLKNKVNIKKYAKSYSDAVKSGKHKKKIRR